MSTSAAKRQILIAVCGTTGVGKTKLALKIAKSLEGSAAGTGTGTGCLNGDSMQVYKGLDIATNKPTKDERDVCAHYLFDFVNPKDEYSVQEFTRDAHACIRSMHQRNETPVLVGGTNYYIQSLLWESNLVDADSSSSAAEEEVGLKHKPLAQDACHESLQNHKLKPQLVEALTRTDPRLYSLKEIEEFCKTTSLHSLLSQIDSTMANKWHPKDSRKLRRSLEIFFTTGMTQSEWYKQQQQKLIYPTILIWLYGKPEQLDARLDARVDNMIARGLVDELLEMRSLLLNDKVVGGASSSSYTRGILQAIGFKEFHPYFEALESGAEKVVVDAHFSKAVEMMKLATRQYARQQVQWIRNKLVPSILEEHDRETGAVYLIDATDPSAVTDKVIEKAISLVKDFATSSPNSDSTIMAPNLSHLLERAVEKESNWQHFKCDFCIDRESGEARVFTGQIVWEAHLASRSHEKQVRYAQAPRPKAGDKEAWLAFQSGRGEKANLNSKKRVIDEKEFYFKYK